MHPGRTLSFVTDPLRLSVIVPVLEEEAQIGDQLEHLKTLAGVDEVLVVDGGSADGTCAVVERDPAARLLHSPRGRALQMNRGAADASFEVLLFLHADVRLPLDAAAQIQAALGEPGTQAGAFVVRTVVDPRAPMRRWLTPFLHWANRRSERTPWPYGDQALFVRASAFNQLGGFPEVPILEDLLLAKSLAQHAPIARAPGPVLVSGRRFQVRPWRTILQMRLIPTLLRWGVSPQRLADWYGVPRA